MKNIWIIPTYNEADNLVELLERLNKILPADCRVLVVDDNSPDGTAKLIKQLQQKYLWLNLLERQDKQGLGEAYRAGFGWALAHDAEGIGEMDADLSHQPEDLPKLINALEQGADLVIGSRRVKGGKIIGWSWYRHVTSWSAMTVARIILGLKTKDVTAGFRLYSKKALDIIPWQNIKSSGYAWQEELVYLTEKNNLKIVEVPTTFTDRKQGQSKLSTKDIVEFFMTLIRLSLKKRKGSSHD